MATLLKKKGYIAVACIAAFILAVALAPFLLSSSAALHFTVSRINSMIPGTVSVESWLVGWQQGILCQQVVYQDPDRGIRLTIPHFTSTQGLLEIVLAPKNLGVIVAENPVIELTGVWPKEESASSAATVQQPKEPSGDIPLWNQITGELRVRDGNFMIMPDDREKVFGLRGVNADIDMYGGVVKFTLDFHALQEQGTVKARGSLNLPAIHGAWLDTLISDTEVSVISLELHDFLAFGAAFSSLPAGEGIVNADFHVKTVGAEDLQFSGIADVSGLKLGGGMLGDDTPSFRNIHLTVDDARWSDDEWLVSKLDLTSDTLSFQGSGQSGPSGRRLTGKGTVNLPVLFDQFPRLLKLREAAFIENGTVYAEGDFQQTDREGSIKLKAAVEDFGGLYDGRKFSWTDPATIIMNGEAGTRDIRVQALRIDAPFLHVEGRGNPDSFIIDAKADLQQAFTEIGRLFQLGWDGSGKLEMAVKGRAADPDDNRVTIDADMTVSNFTLNRQDVMVVPLHQFSMVSSFKAPTSLWREGKGPVGLQIALTSWLGEIFLVLNGERSEGNLFQGYYTTDSTFNLDSLTGFLHAFNKMPEAISMAGDLQVQSAGYLGEKAVEIRELDSEISGFVLVRGSDIFEDQKVHLEMSHSVTSEVESVLIRDLVVAENRDSFFQTGGGLNQILFGNRSVYLHNLRLSSAQTGKIDLAALHLHDWRDPLHKLGAELDSKVDMERFSNLLRGTGLIPHGLSMTGQGSLTLSAKTGDDGSRDGGADMRLSGFSLLREQEKILGGEDIVFRAELKPAGQGDTDISDLRFDSGALQLNAKGRISQAALQNGVELQGEFTPDLAKIAAMLRSWFGIDIKMVGKPTEPFSLAWPLTANAGLESLPVALTSGLHAEKIIYKGMEVQGMELPFSLADQVLHAEVSGQLSGGGMKLVTDTDYSAHPPTVHVRESQQVLAEVQLNKALVTGLLSSVNPLFGVIAEPAGQVGARFESLSWPLATDGGKDASFVSVIDIRNLKLQGKGVLQKVLKRFGLEKEELSTRDNEMSCSGGSGRITCSPVRIGVGDSEMVVSGSVGMDNTLDYLLDLPVTSKLVGQKMFADLQGERIIVPVTGTREKPLVDSKVISGAVDTLVQQLAVKVNEEQ